MPTSLEILLDPVSLAVPAIYGGLFLMAAVFVARDFEQSVRPNTPQAVRT